MILAEVKQLASDWLELSPEIYKYLQSDPQADYLRVGDLDFWPHISFFCIDVCSGVLIIIIGFFW